MGRVQGVGFREFARRRADEAGLAGWVNNLPDRSVECVAEGTSDSLRWFVGQLERGTWLSRVERVEVTHEAPEGLSGFTIGR